MIDSNLAAQLKDVFAKLENPVNLVYRPSAHPKQGELVTVLEFMPELKADAVLQDKLDSLSNTRIIKNTRTLRVVGDGEKVVGLEYEDRGSSRTQELKLAGVFVQIGLVPNRGFLSDIEETNQYGEILVDDKCRTSQPGIYAAGDVTNVPHKQIVVAIGEGAKAGLAAFEDRMVA